MVRNYQSVVYTYLTGHIPGCFEFGAKLLWPVCFWRVLGNEDVVCLANDASHQRQITAVSSHHLKNECSLVEEYTKME